jgi:ammonium transporter, Amt family
MLAAASLLLLMTPALAFFYSGMTRSKSVLNMMMMMMMMSFGALAVVGPVWMLWGYSETFGTNVTGIVGDPFEFFALHDLTNDGGPRAATGLLIGLFANVRAPPTAP